MFLLECDGRRRNLVFSSFFFRPTSSCRHHVLFYLFCKCLLFLSGRSEDTWVINSSYPLSSLDLLIETSHDFFSLRFSLQFWYRWKEGNNSGITSKFEVDPSKRSRVRAERSRKVERKSGRTLEICSVAQSRFRPPPGARTCMHNVPCKVIVPDRCASLVSFSFLFFFFLHPFYDCTKLKSTQPLAALCTDSLHSTPSIYLGHRKLKIHDPQRR